MSNPTTNKTASQPAPKLYACSRCGKEKPRTVEFFEMRRPGVLRGTCRECRNEQERNRSDTRAVIRERIRRDERMLHDSSGNLLVQDAKNRAIVRLVDEMSQGRLPDEGDLLSELMPLLNGPRGIALQIVAHLEATEIGSDKHWKALHAIMGAMARQSKRNKPQHVFENMSEEECLEVMAQFHDRIERVREQKRLTLEAKSSPSDENA